MVERGQETHNKRYHIILPNDIIDSLKKLSGAETPEEVKRIGYLFTLIGSRSLEELLKRGEGQIIFRSRDGLEEVVVFDTENEAP